MASSRVRRGRSTQTLVASWFAARGWPQAESRPASLPGEDILGMGDVSVEVKGSRDMPLLKALRQSQANAKGKLPLVVWRPDGFGPEKIGQWVCAMTLADMTTLLQKAGYAFTVGVGFDLCVREVEVLDEPA